MAKPEWGTKRICLSCGARFYDLNRDPIICPACGSPHDPMAQSRPRRSRAAAPAKPAPAAAEETAQVEEQTTDEGEDVEVEAEAAAETDDSAKEESENEEESDDDTNSAIEDVSELGDDDMTDVIETDIEEDEGER